ncbi:MAG TPA: ATP-binding protein [Bryobacteraceae bacterium]|nr:ATP-binding protein [Bryobacteraceae bacterium]
MPCATRSLTVAANTASLRAVLEFTRTGARESSLPQDRIGELDLLIEEIFMNVCSHAYPDGQPGVVSLTYSVPASGELRVEVADQGAEFNPLTEAPPDLTMNLESRPVGGLGILLIKALAPSIEYRRDRDWNRLTFGMSAGS